MRAALVFLVCLGGCAEPAEVADCHGLPGYRTLSPGAESTLYVVDRLLLPTSAAETLVYGLNLDGDVQNYMDNRFGEILSALVAEPAGFAPQASMDDQVDRGDIILLSRIKSCALTTDVGVGSWLYLGGTSTPPACRDEDDLVCRQHLDGSSSFVLDPVSPGDAKTSGQIVDGRYVGGPGVTTLRLITASGFAPALDLLLYGVRQDMTVTETTQATSDNPGRLGGAIKKTDLDNEVMPAVHQILVGTINRDCIGTSTGMPPCGCTGGATGEVLLELFDEFPDRPGTQPDGDCVVDFAELQNNSTISPLLAPDVDLFDGDGVDAPFSPRQDGVKDSLSLGIAFTAVGATFTYPLDPDEILIRTRR